MQIKIISCQALKYYVYRNDVLIIDLRAKEKYMISHLPNAIWINYDSLESDLAKIVLQRKNKISHILVYCDYGKTSLLAARDLAKSGYSVISLYGGYNLCHKATLPNK